MERKTDDHLKHPREQMGHNTVEQMTQAKHMGNEYNDEALRDVPGYTDLARTRSSEQNIAGYDTLQDQNNGYTELRKSIITKDQYDKLGEHNIYDYSTVIDSTTNTRAINADREDDVDCSTNRENISETSGHKYRNIGKTNLKYYNEQLHISTGKNHSLDASESGIRKQKSVESIGNDEPDYSYVSGFKDRQNDTKHVQCMVQSLNKDFVPASQDNDVHQDMQREECVSERTNKSNSIQAVSPRARLIGVAIVVLAVFVGCLVLVLSLKGKSKNNCNSSDKGFQPQPLTLTDQRRESRTNADIPQNTEPMERKTDDDLEHSREQMGQKTAKQMTQAKHMGSEYSDEATRDVPGYTDLMRTRSSEQNIAGYDTLQDQNNEYTELRKSIVTKDQYDKLVEHNIYDYSTVSDSTTNTKAISADRENGVDCSRDRENISKTSGHKYRNIGKTNLKYYNEQLHISTGNKHSLDASESGIIKQKSVESVGNNEPDYSYVSGFKDRQNDTKHVQGMVQSLNKDFVPASQDNDVHQDMQREECVSERTNKSNIIQAVSPRARLIVVAIVGLAVFVGCLVLVLSLKEKSKNNCNSPDKGDCYHTTSTQYYGTLNYTVSGRACQNWSKNAPHVTRLRPDRDEDKPTNYCRDNSNYKHGTPWCYTEDPDFRWEFCPVFKCNACTMPPKAKPGTTVSYNITFGVVAATYTCQSFKPGVSFPHCPISTCSNGNKWLKFNTSCSVEDRYLNSTKYNGKVSCSVSGTPCMIWNLQKSPLLPINSDDHVTNYCRDPDGKGQPWCYVDHQRTVEIWEFCHVPRR